MLFVQQDSLEVVTPIILFNELEKQRYTVHRRLFQYRLVLNRLKVESFHPYSSAILKWKHHSGLLKCSSILICFGDSVTSLVSLRQIVDDLPILGEHSVLLLGLQNRRTDFGSKHGWHRFLHKQVGDPYLAHLVYTIVVTC